MKFNVTILRDEFGINNEYEAIIEFYPWARKWSWAFYEKNKLVDDSVAEFDDYTGALTEGMDAIRDWHNNSYYKSAEREESNYYMRNYGWDDI